MNKDWSIDIHPHFSRLQVAQGTLHVYANKKGDSWTKNTATRITHNDGKRIGRIVITDPMAGRTIKDIPCLSAPKCEVGFTIGK